MSRQILQDIINDFEVEKFTRFFRAKNDKFSHPYEFLHYDGSDFGEGKKLEELQFQDGNLIVCSFFTKNPLSERSGKKAQYELGKKVLKESQTDAGIFIFYDKTGSFRFSLIYANYLGKRRDWSTFRRFTYFVSKELTNKTFLQRIGDGEFSSLEKIKDTFSVEKVTKEFYEDIANWYFWAVEHCRFPKDAEAEENGRNVAVIRLITRIIFIWFMRERGLVPKELFEEKNILAVLKNTTPENSTYYRAILQNLFFATLSTKKKERQFRSEKRFNKGWNKDFGNQNVYRYHELFASPEKIQDYFGNIPFLNGGLFECFDDGRNDIYIDGFTERKKEYQPEVPNFFFFSGEKKVDLNTAYGTKNKTYKIRGLLNILSSFNFTIDENSPDDQDIALDPELLGRVFENLLASFNPETSTTARKATGSYYTPREIVDYMVTESLKAYFKTHLSDIKSIDEKLDNLFSTGSEENPFGQQESKIIVDLVERVRIIDPAVGSGAFPMGALNKMVFVLNKVDPGNELWKQAQLTAVETIPDPRIKQDAKNRIVEFFKDKKEDYGRKLYLIQKCIYGVDIQQIAVEITKLRFFISLLVDEEIDKKKENWGIEPLPNLDFKIMQGNSLIEILSGVFTVSNTDQKRIEIVSKLKKAKDDLFDISSPSQKKQKRKEINELIQKNFEYDKNKKIKELKEGIWAIQSQEQRLFEDKISERDDKKKIEEFKAKINELSNKNPRPPSEHFEWHINFSEVFQEKGGFDVVIGNPPYGASYPEEHKKYFQIHYESAKTREITRENEKLKLKGSFDTFSLFIDKSINIMNNSSYLAFIVPLAITSSDSVTALHHKIFRECQSFKVSTFSNRPKKIFDSADQRVAVIFANKTNSKIQNLFTTKVNKRYESTSVQEVIDNLSFVNSLNFVKYGRLPKVGSDIELSILKKLFSSKNSLKDLKDGISGKPVYYRTSGGRYYNIITNFTTHSSKENSFNIIKKYRDLVAALLSSNLYFWFYHIYSNNLDLKTYELEIFPIPIEKLSDKKISEIEQLYKEYLEDLNKNSRIKKVNYAHISQYREYYARYSKKIIDKIDLAIKDAYSLTDEEINFIINYDIEFRTDDEE